MMNNFINSFLFLDTLVGSILIMSALWIFTFSGSHLLAVLMSLEGMMLGQFILLSAFLLRLGVEYYFLLFFLVVVVCEAALGLSILVSIVRTHGNDYFASFNVLQC